MTKAHLSAMVANVILYSSSGMIECQTHTVHSMPIDVRMYLS